MSSAGINLINNYIKSMSFLLSSFSIDSVNNINSKNNVLRIIGSETIRLGKNQIFSLDNKKNIINIMT